MPSDFTGTIPAIGTSAGNMERPLPTVGHAYATAQCETATKLKRMRRSLLLYSYLLYFTVESLTGPRVTACKQDALLKGLEKKRLF